MNKAETFIEACRLAAREEDFSLVDKIYHPDYSAFDHSAGVEVNLESDKQVILTLRHEIKATIPTIVSESDNFLQLHRYNRYRNADIFNSVTTSIHYKDGKIINQESVIEELEYDPSEGQDWNGDDYE
mgnify:CR=1 FL=1